MADIPWQTVYQGVSPNMTIVDGVLRGYSMLCTVKFRSSVERRSHPLCPFRVLTSSFLAQKIWPIPTCLENVQYGGTGYRKLLCFLFLVFHGYNDHEHQTAMFSYLKNGIRIPSYCHCLTNSGCGSVLPLKHQTNRVQPLGSNPFLASAEMASNRLQQITLITILNYGHDWSYWSCILGWLYTTRIIIG